MGDIRRSGEMLPVFDPTCCKFRCGRAERTTSVGVLLRLKLANVTRRIRRMPPRASPISRSRRRSKCPL